MDRIIGVLNEIGAMNSEYTLSNEVVNQILQDTRDAKVCTPIIGRFSSGKSALVNTILGYNRKILREDITPETAIPAEITYCEAGDTVVIYGNDNSTRSMDVAEYRSFEADATSVRCSHLKLRNEFLEEISDVMLVDMPGFDSGFDIHNKAIDSYLPQSMAYIIAFPEDEMVLKTTIRDILKELSLHDMPICVVITKYDKHTDDFEVKFSNLKDSLKRVVGNSDITYCLTTSLWGDADELKDFLRKIQAQSQHILVKKFKQPVLATIETTESYLNAKLKSNALSESELDDQEERFGKQLDELNSSFTKEKNGFDVQISSCVEEIKADIQASLDSEEATFVAMVMNGDSINEKMNTVIRNAVAVSVKKRFVPKVERYLKRVANCIGSDAVGDVHVTCSFDAETASKGMVSTTVAAAAAVLIAGPIIGGIIAGIIALANKLRNNKKREEAKNQIKAQLQSEVFPKVLDEVGNGLEAAITQQLALINTSIEEEINTQRNVLEKAISDAHKQAEDEKENKKNLEARMKADLDRITSMKEKLFLDGE